MALAEPTVMSNTYEIYLAAFVLDLIFTLGYALPSLSITASGSGKIYGAMLFQASMAISTKFHVKLPKCTPNIK